MIGGEDIIKLKEMDEALRDLARKNIRIIRDCYRCGKCCHDNKILVTIPEIARINKVVDDFFTKIFAIDSNKVTVSIRKRWVNKGKNGSKVCIFYKDGECTIHEVKPFQCMTYPVIFYPHFSELGVKVVERGNEYIFFCQGEKGKKMVCEIDKNAFIEITKMRLHYLSENYRIQTILIATRKLRKVVYKLL